MIQKSLLVTTVLLLAACGGGDGDAQTAADTLTRDQKDSIIADLPIPGAGAVGRALDARGTANSRTEAHDTLNR